MACFEIKNLNFQYPSLNEDCKDYVLTDISLTINQGEYITLCGMSGSGKTTLLRHLKSVLSPHGKKTGDVLLDGVPIEQVDLRTQSEKIGFVMQDPDSQIVTDKVWHELAFGLESLGMNQKDMRLRVAEMASYFGIQDWFYKETAFLSGGQKQLLNLASIMAVQPDVLIFDEPTSQLDPIAASDFLNTVRKINAELGTTVIITEHRLEDVFYASDRVTVMDKGRIIVDDVPERAGKFLKDERNEMFAAMPVPLKVYYSMENYCAGKEVSGRSQKLHTGKWGNEISAPLTVGEGRKWLDYLFSEKKSEEMESSIIRKSSSEDRAEIIEDTSFRNSAVSFKDVWFRYEKDSRDVLKGTSFDVPKSSIFAMVGGNGTGKTTVLNTICGMCRPYRGNVFINGKKLKSYRDRDVFKGNLSMLPQDPRNLFVKKTVREELYEMFDKEIESDLKDERIERICALCHTENILDSHPYDLSGGEQQRAALAKVLLTEPEILLLDEPTKGIDSFFKKALADILSSLKKQGTTVIIVSHDVEFCAEYTDYTGMFFDGNVVTVNTSDKFFADNSFYTTAANRMSRHVFDNVITAEDVISLCQKNL